MDKNVATTDLILRDAAGIFYLLRPPMLAKAKATAAQQAELKRRMADDTHGFTQFVIDIGAFVFPKQIAVEQADFRGGGVRRAAPMEAGQPSPLLAKRTRSSL